MTYEVRKASKKELTVMLTHVKRFDSAEFVKVLEKFKKMDYIVFGANGNMAVNKAIRAITLLNPGRQYITRAINKYERVVVRV